ncbi:hypothetical protein [Parvularcula sp. IMCC14364]|uniref:hypothetical protein n=1 Tax=Parvularcula sp. IMCC14364 TaxID=3067902 RepID=UPI0027420715|nr:hypothetical protein [Parvularcula sp. IMCC14364]
MANHTGSLNRRELLASAGLMALMYPVGVYAQGKSEFDDKASNDRAAQETLQIENGPATAMVMGTRTMIDMVRPTEPVIADFVEGSLAIAEMAIAQTIRENAGSLAGVLAENEILNWEQAERLQIEMQAKAGPRFVGEAQEKMFLESTVALAEQNIFQNESAGFYNRLAIAIENAGGQGSEREPVEIPPEKTPPRERVPVEECPGKAYQIVSSTERLDKLQTSFGVQRYPLYCFDKVEDEDELEAVEATYKGVVKALYTDNYPDQDMRHVQRQWSTDLKVDLPKTHTRDITGRLTIANYEWRMVERESTNPVFDGLVARVPKILTAEQEKLVREALEKAAKAALEYGTKLLAAELGPVAAEILPKILNELGVYDLPAQLAAEGAEYIIHWVLDLISDLFLQPRAFPGVKITHVVIWPDPCKEPVNVVSIAMRAPGGRALMRLPFGEYDTARSRVADRSSYAGAAGITWIGASRPVARMPNEIMERVVYGSPSAVLWRQPQQGLGAIVKLPFPGADPRKQIYTLALRTDMREVS